jgi:hypothetical protein
MNFDKWLEDAESAVHLGSLADRVVLIIARVQNSGQVQFRTGDHDALVDAMGFVRKAKRGFALLEEPSVNSNSRSFVSSFSAAARSLGVGASSSKFVDEMGLLEDILQRLADSKRDALRDPRLDTARAFFGRLAAEATDAVTDAVGRTPASSVNAWSQRSAS